jgi:hypothetical protein
MRQLVLITFIVVCFLGTIQADVPDIHPDIYAICNVVTKEGTEVEGVLLMARGIALNWKPSGPPAYHRIKRWKKERARWRKQIEELGCIDWVTVLPQPVWFHDLVKNNKLYKIPFRPWLH